MAEAFIVRKGGVATDSTAAPTITIITEAADGVTFTLTNNDDNTAIIVYEIDSTQDFIELAAAATSDNITVALSAGTYTLSAFATVVGEVATSATASVTIVIPQYELLYSETVATAKTQIDITGLSIGKDDGLRLVYTFKNGTSTTSGIRIYPNNLTTDTNYHSQFLQGGGSAIAAGRFNQNRITQVNATDSVSGFADIKISNNDRFVCQAQTIYDIGSGSSNIFNTNWNVVGTETVSSITSLSINAFEANGIKIGSKIALYKVTEAA